jgi:two-component system, NarL family, nitrate/nitrite response regulator NarL
MHSRRCPGAAQIGHAKPAMPDSPGKSESAPVVVIASSVAGLRKRCREALFNGYSLHESADRGELERGIVGHRPAAVLLDITLPGLGGASGIASVQKLRTAAKIIVLTGAPDEREGIAILKAGARGYCHRDIDIALLEKATHVVLKGEIWVGRKLIPHLLEELTVLTEQRRRDAPGKSDERLERVTPREREIVDLLSAGASNKEIAKRLNVTERTVKAHLTAIFRKLGLSGRLQLALFALEHGRSARESEAIGPRFN